jgi:arginase
MRTIEIVGVPMDLGGNRRGVDMGPSAIRYAGLAKRLASLGFEVRDRGNLQVADRATSWTRKEVEDLKLTEQLSAPVRDPKAPPRPPAHHATEIVRVATELADVVAEIEREKAFPLVIGGDHSIGMGTLAGIAAAGRRPGVIWIDAHGDINTPDTTPSGNVHGMPFAVALGLAGAPFPAKLRGSVSGGSSALLATRSLDDGERDNIKKAGVTAITMADIDRMGMGAAMERAIAIASKGDGIHLSLDMDAIDPDEAPGVGTPVRGGLTYREAQLAMEMLAASGKLRSLEVAEVNPILDRENRTAQLAVELIASALGQTIL